jgi:hypothetical protein
MTPNISIRYTFPFVGFYLSNSGHVSTTNLLLATSQFRNFCLSVCCRKRKEAAEGIFGSNKRGSDRRLEKKVKNFVIRTLNQILLG